jgi:hypothetical protein
MSCTTTIVKQSDASIATRFRPTHGESSDQKRRGSTYIAWQSMLQRCHYQKHKDFHRYGGAGISVCDRWRKSYSAFLADMGRRPNGMTLDRYPNATGNYEPGNCRWATHKDQARNRKNTKLLTAFGRTALMIEFAEAYGIAMDTLNWRLKLGIAPEQALTAPVKRGNRIADLRREDACI